MGRIRWITATFAIMYLVATIIGVATYLLISPLAMWICVFTLMPVVSAILIYGYLRKMRFHLDATGAETVKLLGAWVGMSFFFDALTYVLIVPALNHTAMNWTFFRDQSPWIWLSYAVLLISGYAGRAAYLRSGSLRSTND